MKYLALASMILSLSAHAGEKPKNWVCEVQNSGEEGGKKSELKISLLEPLISLTNYTKASDGSFTSSTEDLVTAELLSQWKAPKAECMVDTEFRDNEAMDSYSFDFNCTGIVGNFSMNFRESSAFYLETMPELNLKRDISLENCQAQAAP